MSLNWRGILAFCVFAAFTAIASYFWFIVPVSVWGYMEAGGHAGMLTGMLCFFTPLISLPVGIIAGFLVLLVINPSLKATTLSLSHSVAFVIAIALSAVIGIVMTYAAAVIIYFLLPLFFLEPVY